MLCSLILVAALLPAAELPTRHYLNLGAVKTLAAAAEAEAAKRQVAVTICIVDDAGQLLFLQRGEGASAITVEFAQKKARHAAFYGSPSKQAGDAVHKGDNAALSFPQYFPNQGGLPIKVQGQILGAISVSGAASEIDEAIAQVAIDALLK
jgi:glc operon protein GlcG